MVKKNRTTETSDNLAGLISLALDSLLPLRGVRITLCCKRATALRFVHAHALSAWLRTLSRQDDTSWFTQLRLDTPEAGRTNYAASDLYVFNLFSTASGYSSLARVLDAFWYPSPSTADTASEHVFGRHWKLHTIVDFFSNETIRGVESLSTYDQSTLIAESEFWSSTEQQTLVWQWLSPARILRPKNQRDTGEGRFCRDATHIDAGLLLERAQDGLAGLLRAHDQSPPPRERDKIPTCVDTSSTVFWIEDDYHPDGKTPKPKGGLLGRQRFLVALPSTWATVLVLGQYLGIGQGAATGLGRYRLETPGGQYSYLRGYPSRSWIDIATSPENIRLAWRHVRSRRPESADRAMANLADSNIFHESSNDEYDEPAAGADDLFAIMEHRVAAIKEGRYKPPPASATFIPKDDGGYRPLAVPPFWDAVLQRAFSQVLTEPLDSMMHPLSFGYRRGRSRHGAARAIQRARRQGYRWIYDADIEDFFGSVVHANLSDRLLSLFDDDPVIDLIMAWVGAEVRWQGQNYPRTRGLPQGSSLSPLLANLMLDDFDNDMAAAGLKLVRFADDFVVLCKSRDKAQQAAKIATKSLEEHRFSLHPEKSDIRDLDDGVDFVGYLFVNDMAIDLSGKTTLPSSKRTIKLKPEALQAQAGHWLAKLGQKRPAALTERQLLAFEARHTLDQLHTDDDQAISIDEQIDPDGVVFVVGGICALFTEAGRLAIVRDDERILTRPWKHIRHLILFGAHHISTPAVRSATSHSVTVHLGSSTGRYQGVISNGMPSQGHKLWLEQAVTAESLDFCLPISQELIKSRIRHQGEVLRLRRSKAAGNNTTLALRQCRSAESLAQLNGIEGKFAADYFAAFSDLIPDDFEFVRRQRRPPPDPVNALLSFGYTTLYSYADTILRANGLLPWLGVYHRSRGQHAALASDMIEPFRHIVEQLVLSLLRRGSLKQDQFTLQPNGSCLLDTHGRRRFIADLSSRLAQPVKSRGDTEPLPVRLQIHRQCHSLVQAIRRRDAAHFKVFRIR